MTIAKMLSVTTLAAAALALAVPASAAPHHHRPHKVRVCKAERHHHKSTRVCRWVRR